MAFRRGFPGVLGLAVGFCFVLAGCGGEEQNSGGEKYSCDTLSAESINELQKLGPVQKNQLERDQVKRDECIWGSGADNVNGVSVFVYESADLAKANKNMGTAFKPITDVSNVDEAHFMGKFIREDCTLKMLKQQVSVEIRLAPKPYDEVACKASAVKIANDYAQRNFTN